MTPSEPQTALVATSLSMPWGTDGRLQLLLLRGGQIDHPRARTLALDGAHRGFVADASLDFVSLDHHDGCVRFVTRATCEQVRDALRLHPRFTQRFDTVVINDLDGDTVLSLYLLDPERSALITSPDSEPRRARLLRLVAAVGTVDALGPAVLARLPHEERGLADAFYRTLHDDVGIPRFAAARHFDRWPEWLRASLSAIDGLLDRDPAERVGTQPTPASLRELIRTDRFVIAEADGPVGMLSLYEAGHEVVVLATPPRNGRRQYTIGKPSDLGRGNVRAALDALCAREPGWGGGSSIGGSPRATGSALTPNEVAEVLRGAL